jgi:hypothetical protein
MVKDLTETERAIIQQIILDRWNPLRLNKKIASHFGLTINQVRHIRSKSAFQTEYKRQLAIYQSSFEEIQSAFSPYWVPWVRTVHQGVSTRLREPRAETYGILRMTPDLTSVITEGLYLSNPPEAQLLALPQIQELEGRVIAAGIHRFLTTQDPGSGFRPEFFDPHTTGTGTARGCVDSEITPPAGISTGFTAEEHEDLVATARRLGKSTDWLLRFGVHTLEFLSELPGAAAIAPLAAADRPDAYGPVAETVAWNQAEQAVLVRMADAYGITRTQVQKLGAILMVFLAGLEDPAATQNDATAVPDDDD